MSADDIRRDAIRAASDALRVVARLRDAVMAIGAGTHMVVDGLDEVEGDLKQVLIRLDQRFRRDNTH